MSKNLQSSPNLYLLGYHQIPPWLSSKRLQRTSVGEGKRKENSCTLLVGTQSGAGTMENSKECA